MELRNNRISRSSVIRKRADFRDREIRFGHRRKPGGLSSDASRNRQYTRTTRENSPVHE